MTLSDYKRETGITYSHIARQCHVTPAMISQVAAGSIKPSFDLARRIEAATGGNVSRETWYPDTAVIELTIGMTSA